MLKPQSNHEGIKLHTLTVAEAAATTSCYPKIIDAIDQMTRLEKQLDVSLKIN